MPGGGYNKGSTHEYWAGGKPLYRQPDPITVAKIWDQYGKHVALERWFFVSETELREMAKVGRYRMAKRVA
ncbi:hypothetical protein GCM10007989_13490 [Devosia pacifica]|uniref:Uncharacterized protein n=1 Tax=Devosia pacifica TaxID=1335967 RepID=A0A918S3R8_9HYPH|nr:hypothetical protein [Devosia pacifica]GHA19286.1 hypothetical protein GCM10007989_13490 [Devosia pacifica]